MKQTCVKPFVRLIATRSSCSSAPKNVSINEKSFEGKNSRCTFYDIYVKSPNVRVVNIEKKKKIYVPNYLSDKMDG